MSNIRVEGIDADGTAIWYDAWSGDLYTAGEQPTTEERDELIRQGWDGTTKPWIVPDE